jgi:hypothetical protein
MASKRCRSACGSYPKFHTNWKIRKRNLLLFTTIPVHNLHKIYKYSMYNMCLELKPIRIDIPCMPIPIPTRKNYADPTRPTVIYKSVYQCPIRSCKPEYEVGYLLENGLERWLDSDHTETHDGIEERSSLHAVAHRGCS